MTMTEDPRAAENQHYDPDKDVFSQESPHLKPVKPNLDPTPSPEPSDSEDSPSENEKPNNKRIRRSQVATQGDAVLIGLLGGGKAIEVARTAGEELLQSDTEMSSPDSHKGAEMDVSEIAATSSAPPNLDLAALAAGALDGLKAHQAAQTTTSEAAPAQGREVGESQQVPNGTPSNARAEAHNDMKSEPMDDASNLSPKIAEVNGVTELAPIQQHSPKSDERNGMTLPSIQSQLGISNIAELKHIAEAATAKSEKETTSLHAHRPSFTQSSQSPPRLPVFHPPQASHGSPPPVSPNHTYHQAGLPSPAPRPPVSNTSYYATYASRPSVSADGNPYQPSVATPGDYSSSATETPGSDPSGATPGSGIPHGIDRMSIDNMTNPQIGGFQCTYPGCTAQPFQTQYLLNSHANVHSSNRPHYCPVKGCPRSEGGKGFKRKNEMIRHGLVHESPGYVCPYCVDREHRYPRPDNLQRHVRVHHVDKDKDDPLLRDVLAQRPEGPSRGRRRRGGKD